MKDADAMYRRYKALRKKGYSATCAARDAVRPQEKTVLEWTDGAASVEIGPYAVDIKQEYDPDPDLSWFGAYSDTPGVDAIDRDTTGDRGNSREYRYWNPATTLDEQYRDLHRAGHAKADAWLKALEYRERDYNRMERFNRGHWAMVGIVATARIGGMVCGSASLWGIESDGGDYIDEMALEIAGEAAHEADASRDSMIRARAEEIAALASVARRNV
jgi:hypothetical protein